MPEIRDLWWGAGRLAYEVPSTNWEHDRWIGSVWRSASLIEPGWPTGNYGGSYTGALPTVALLLYTRPASDDPRKFPVKRIVEALRASEPAIEDVIRQGLASRRHRLDDGSEISGLVRQLTEYREPITHMAGGTELASMDQWPGGTMMGAAAKWAAQSLTYHHLDTASAD
ncbi:hypothetical protein [Streptomyces sp. NPDC015350]|uniref:hypothetical protein n=1 Tax=Streptomyces sp. NPDC015350 TaxID=3364955 RepID=UPI003703020E